MREREEFERTPAGTMRGSVEKSVNAVLLFNIDEYIMVEVKKLSFLWFKKRVHKREQPSNYIAESEIIIIILTLSTFGGIIDNALCNRMVQWK